MKDFTEIDLMQLATALLRKLWLLVLCAVLAGVGAYIYTSYFITPMYRTSVSVYVNNISSEQLSGTTIEYVSGANLSTSAQLVTTYVNIIKSDTVLSKVVERSGLDVSVEAVRGMMTASPIENTEMFEIYVSGPDPEQAAQVANAIAEVAPEEISKIVEGSSTKIIDYAKIPRSAYSPNYRENVLTAAAIGAALAAVYVVLRALLDKRIKNEEMLERLSDLPILGIIPEFGSERKAASGYGYGYGYSSQAPKPKGGDQA